MRIAEVFDLLKLLRLDQKCLRSLAYCELPFLAPTHMKFYIGVRADANPSFLSHVRLSFRAKAKSKEHRKLGAVKNEKPPLQQKSSQGKFI
ncbi:MAG: hypothetical protein PUP92_28850 [Rhizonema sp. PD38]|nr:hypothetical protein [Rhizonema sp. PD38]